VDVVLVEVVWEDATPRNKKMKITKKQLSKIIQEEFARARQEARSPGTYKSSHEEKADIKADAAFADDTLDNLDRLMDRTGQIFSDDEEKILTQAFELLDRLRRL
jgi:ribosome assembly protein YihI (activator of Der GTPase)